MIFTRLFKRRYIWVDWRWKTIVHNNNHNQSWTNILNNNLFVVLFVSLYLKNAVTGRCAYALSKLVLVSLLNGERGKVKPGKISDQTRVQANLSCMINQKCKLHMCMHDYFRQSEECKTIRWQLSIKKSLRLEEWLFSNKKLTWLSKN